MLLVMNIRRTPYVIGLLLLTFGLILTLGVFVAVGNINNTNVLTNTFEDGSDDGSVNGFGGVNGAELRAGGTYEKTVHATSLSTTSGAGEASLGPNLLDNPTCIVDGQGNGDEPLYWTVEQGELECGEPEPDFMPDPIEGDYVFIDWEDLEPTTDESIATQAVPVTGGSEYQFSVWVGSDNVENDYAQFEVQFLDDGTLIDDGMIDSGEFQPEDHEEPDQFVETTEAPENADEAVVRIKLVNGGDVDLERPLLWADDIRLQELSDAPTAFDVEGIEMGIEQTLDPDWTLFDDEFGEDEDDRGFDDSGEISHFGGGDLGGSVTGNDAGDTAGLAGGDLRVNSDGTFSLTNPTQTGTFEFEYRLEYEDNHDDATVTIVVSDHELDNPLCNEWDDAQQNQPIGWSGEDFSCLDLDDLPFTETDHTAVGERSFTDNYLNLDDEVETEQTVYVVGGETYTVSGLYGTDTEDEFGQVDFEYLDADGNVIADEGFVLEDLQSETTTDFDRFTEAPEAPDNAKQATLRLTVVRPSGHQDPAGVYFDDLSIEAGDPGDDPVNAYDVKTEVGVYHTFDPSETLFDDWGNGVDELGTPDAELVNFGGGDLSDSVSDHGPGDEVSFAGGTLTVGEDGSFSLEEPTDLGTHTFQYEIENEHDSSVATVEIWVRDSTLLDADCEADAFDAWNDVSPGNGIIGCIDPQESGQSQPNGEQEPPVPPSAIGDRGGDGYNAVGEQTVPIRDGFTYELAGFVGTEETPADSYVTLEIDYLDEDGAELAVSDEDDLDLSEMRSVETDEFDAFSDTTVPPEDATHATVRIFINSPGETPGESYARAYVDDLSFELLGTPPEANDIDLDVDVDETLTASVLDDHGHGADDLGEPDAEVASFGGGDLDGDATEHDAGDTVDLTDGDLTIESDGTLEFVATVEPDSYEFDYRLANDAGSDDATVTIEVIDQSFFEVSIEETNTPVEGETLTIDATVENTGDNDGTRVVVLEIEDEDEAIVFDDDQEVSLEEGTNDTVSFEWETEADDGGAYDATVSSGDDTVSETLTVFSRLDLEGTVVDLQAHSPSDAPIEGASVTLTHPDESEDETTTNDEGEFTFESVPGTGEEYEIDASAAGYDPNATTVTVDGFEPIDDVSVGLEGNATVSGQIEDTTFETGVSDADVTLEAGGIEYAATTDSNGAYEAAVPGTDENYTVSANREGWEASESVTTPSVGDDEDIVDVDIEITGDASDDITFRDSGTDVPLEGATVAIEQETLGLTENAFTSDGDGNMEVVVPGGFTYAYEFSKPGYTASTIPLRSFNPGHRLSANYKLAGNAEITGEITDSENDDGIEGATISAQNGTGAYEATTSADGSYTIERVPGGHDYDVTIEKDGYEPATLSEERVADEAEHELDANLTGTATLSGDLGDSSGVALSDVEVTASGDAGEYTVETGGDGAYAFALPGDEEYTLTVEAEGYESVETDVTVDDEEDKERDIELVGDATLEVEIVGEDSALPPEPDSAGTVAVERSGVVYDGSQSDTDPIFVIEDVPSVGEYTLEASDLDGFEDGSETITITESGTNAASLVLEESGEIDLQVETDETNVGIEAASVTVEYEADHWNQGATTVGTTDDTGELSFGVPGNENSYTVEVEATGYDFATEESGSIGSGASQSLVVGLLGNASISGIVENEVTGSSIADADIQVAPIGTDGEFTAETNADGEFTVENVPGTGEHEVVVTADGYTEAAMTETVGDGEDVSDVTVELEGNAIVSGQVEDTTFESDVPDIEVSAESAPETYTGETDEDGSYTLAVPGTGEEYTVSADPDGWEENSRTASVGDGEEVTDVDLELTGDADVRINWADNRTDERLEGVTVTVESDNLGSTEFTSDDAGQMEFNLPSGQLYTLIASKDGYTDREITYPPTRGQNTLNFVIGGNAELTGSVTDTESGGGVEGVTVTAENGAGAYSATTGADGSYEIDVLPGGQEYEIAIERDGYEPVTIPEESIGDGADHERDVELSGDATIEVEVVSERTGDALEDVTVEAIGSDSAGPYTASTADNGSVVFEAVSSADSYDLEIVTDGYETVTIDDVDLESGETAELDATIEYSASIDGTVIDRLTGEPLEDAAIEFTEVGTDESFIAEDATDADGAYEVAVPGYAGLDTKYNITVSADDYESETERSETVLRPGDSETIDVALIAPGEETIFGEITDAVTGEPIADASVTIEIDDERVDAELTFETETDADGAYEATDIVGGYNYTLTVNADGYDDTTTAARVDTDKELDLSLSGDSTLEIDVVGEQFGDELEDATVEVMPVDGASTYEGTHDGDGTYTVDTLPSGVEYTVTAAATGYETVEFDQDLEESGTTTVSEPVLLDGNAVLEVAAADLLTDESINGASLTIEREDDGNQFEPAEMTDVNGVLSVTLPGTGDEYGVTASATGYGESTATTDAVDSGAPATVRITLEGDSTIDGSVTDRVTGDALEGANVTANASGYVLETTTTASGSYELTGVPGERSYAVTVEEDDYRSNETTAAPAGETVTLTNSLWPVHEGDGTDDEPYRITNAAELQAIGAELDAYYVLEGHLDAAEADVWHDSDGFEPIGDSDAPFTGSFDGAANTISNLTVDRDSDDKVGLFSVVDDGSLENVVFRNVTVAGTDDVGGLVGSLEEDSSVDGVDITGTVEGTNAVGGVAGTIEDSTISTTRSALTVSGTDDVGGVAGWNGGTVSQSLAIGAVDATTGGGLVGGGTGDVADSYWDTQTTNQRESAGSSDLEGLSTSELSGTNVTANTALEFGNTWTALDTEYPRLGWMVDEITLTLEDETVEPGDEIPLAVSVDLRDGSTAYANETATYSSPEEDVVSIENATVEAIDDGVATLTARVAGAESALSVTVESPSSSSSSPRSSDISVTGVAYTDTELLVGEPITMTVSLENDGSRSGTYTVDSTLDGQPHAEYDAILDASQTKTVNVTHVFEGAGTYTFAVDDRSVTLEVAADGGTDDPVDEESDEGAGDDSTADESNSTEVADEDSDAAEEVGTDETSEDDPGDPETDEGDDDSADTIPGFGAIVTLVVLLSFVLFGRRQ